MRFGCSSLPRRALGLASMALGLGLAVVHAQSSLRFSVRPYDVTAGDSMVFTYLESASTLKYEQIQGWKWDFDGDGVWDVERTVNGTTVTASLLTTAWPSAVFDLNKGSGTTDYRQYTPRLQVIPIAGAAGVPTGTITVISSNNATASGHGFTTTGSPIQLSGTVPTGLTTNTTYYVIVVDANRLAFATTKANALAGTKIAISGSTGGKIVPVYAVETGVTEDVYGLDGVVDPQIVVRKPVLLDEKLTASFSASPRLCRSATGLSNDPYKTTQTKFYAEVAFADGKTGTITNYEWDFDNNGSADVTGADKDGITVGIGTAVAGGDYTLDAPQSGSNATLRYTVGLKVGYRLSSDPEATVRTTDWITYPDYLVIQNQPAVLSMGRAYRQGFPERYGWDEVINAYSAPNASGNSYSYFNLLEEAYLEQQGQLTDPLKLADASQRRTMAEVVNELLQGQTLRGFQTMIDALRMRYPRITDRGAKRLPTPAGTREETAALETAALDFQQALQYSAFTIRAYGPEILRATGVDAVTGKAPYPQFPQYVTFTDATLTGSTGKEVPIPVKNEYWQLSVAAGGQGQARVEKAKLLWRASTQDATTLPEAKEECKVAATQSYLAMALLTQGQTDTQFQQNESNNLQAHLRNATDLFDKIAAGVNPSGSDGSYIPNESFAAIYQDAQSAATEARNAEITARDEKRLFDRNQADLRNELLNQRNQYITPLTLLTGIDPDDYGNLATESDRRDYRNAFNSRLNALLQNYPNADASRLGQYGQQVAKIFDAGLAIQDQITALNNLAADIEISRWANTEVDRINNDATEKLKASDIARGYANAFSYSAGVSYGFTGLPSISAGVSYSPGSIRSGQLNADDQDTRALQQARIADVQLEVEIRKTLLQTANAAIAIRRAGVQLDQAKLELDSMRAQMERYIEDLAHTRATAADLYFLDPSFRIAASQAEQRAIAKMEYAVDKLYRLARTLEYEWTEAYQNPVVIPPASNEPPALENTLFDKFTKLDSLFAVRSADEALDYLEALKAWDSKLRRINGASVRGPNKSAPISAVPISLREKVFGYQPRPAEGYTLEKSIAEFRNLLENARVANFYNPANPSLELRFPIGIEDNSYFPATGSRWNLRLHTVAAEVYAESGFSDQQVLEIDLIQGGMVTLRRFFANPPYSDDLLKMTHTVDNLNRTVFATAFPARINGATAGRPLTEFDNPGLRGRPVAATDWILRINTENPANRNIDFDRIKDIVLKFTYTYGNPEEFDGF
jgi:hypothetical protein